MPELHDKYKVSRIGIFGSMARGEAKETSDIDILVEFSEPVGMFHFFELKEFLESILGKKIDLVTKNALKPAIKDSIINEVIYA